MGKDDEFKNALRFLELEGWHADPPNNKGYIRVKCTCGGLHMGWLHKTPSNPQHFREKAQHLAGLCHQYTEELP